MARGLDSFAVNYSEMKKMETLQLLESLQSDTRKIILAVRQLQQEDPELLNETPGHGRWSVAQVIEHLNSYGRYYLPAIDSAMKNNTGAPDPVYKPGWLGDYFTRSMLPGKNGQVVNKMKSPSDHRPQAEVDSKPVIDEFLKQQHTLLELLERAKHVNIAKLRIPITLSRLLKLKLGDTFRFLVAHHQRHFVQVQNTLRAVKEVVVT
jgi:hypothetical protein